MSTNLEVQCKTRKGGTVKRKHGNERLRVNYPSRLILTDTDCIHESGDPEDPQSEVDLKFWLVVVRCDHFKAIYCLVSRVFLLLCAKW